MFDMSCNASLHTPNITQKEQLMHNARILNKAKKEYRQKFGATPEKVALNTAWTIAEGLIYAGITGLGVKHSIRDIQAREYAVATIKAGLTLPFSVQAVIKGIKAVKKPYELYTTHSNYQKELKNYFADAKRIGVSQEEARAALKRLN